MKGFKFIFKIHTIPEDGKEIEDICELSQVRVLFDSALPDKVDPVHWRRELIKSAMDQVQRRVEQRVDGFFGIDLPVEAADDSASHEFMK